VNKVGYQLPLAKEWVRYASSLNYSMNLLFAIKGGGPALAAARAMIAVAPFQRGFAILDAAVSRSLYHMSCCVLTSI
jgi:hypothetical protein